MKRDGVKIPPPPRLPKARKKSTSFYLAPATAPRLRKLAARYGRSQGGVIDYLVELASDGAR